MKHENPDDITQIRVTKGTRKDLRRLGLYGDDDNEIVRRLVDAELKRQGMK